MYVYYLIQHHLRLVLIYFSQLNPFLGFGNEFIYVRDNVDLHLAILVGHESWGTRYRRLKCTETPDLLRRVSFTTSG